MIHAICSRIHFRMIFYSYIQTVYSIFKVLNSLTLFVNCNHQLTRNLTVKNIDKNYYKTFYNSFFLYFLEEIEF